MKHHIIFSILLLCSGIQSIQSREQFKTQRLTSGKTNPAQSKAVQKMIESFDEAFHLHETALEKFVQTEEKNASIVAEALEDIVSSNKLSKDEKDLLNTIAQRMRECPKHMAEHMEQHLEAVETIHNIMAKMAEGQHHGFEQVVRMQEEVVVLADHVLSSQKEDAKKSRRPTSGVEKRIKYEKEHARDEHRSPIQRTYSTTEERTSKRQKTR